MGAVVADLVQTSGGDLLADGVVIQSAELRCYQVGTTGQPHADLVQLLVDHADYGATLEGGDFAVVAIDFAMGVLSSDGTVGWKTLVITYAN